MDDTKDSVRFVWTAEAKYRKRIRKVIESRYALAYQGHGHDIIVSPRVQALVLRSQGAQANAKGAAASSLKWLATVVAHFAQRAKPALDAGLFFAHPLRGIGDVENEHALLVHAGCSWVVLSSDELGPSALLDVDRVLFWVENRRLKEQQQNP